MALNYESTNSSGVSGSSPKSTPPTSLEGNSAVSVISSKRPSGNDSAAAIDKASSNPAAASAPSPPAPSKLSSSSGFVKSLAKAFKSKKKEKYHRRIHEDVKRFAWYANDDPNQEGPRFPIVSLYYGLPEEDRKRFIFEEEVKLEFYCPEYKTRPSIETAPVPEAKKQELKYNKKIMFGLLQSLDGSGNDALKTKTLLATVKQDGLKGIAQFVVLKSYGKKDKEGEQSRGLGSMRREFRAYRRIAAQKEDSVGLQYVLQLHASLEDRYRFYFATDFMQCDLTDVFRGRTSYDRLAFSLQWTAQMATGIHFLHNSGIIHRDIKPHNIFLDWQGNVRIADLGTSYIDEKDEPLSGDRNYAYAYRGTIPYMAPELVQTQSTMFCQPHIGEDGDFDEKIARRKVYGREIDYWGLGCIVFELTARKYNVFFLHSCYNQDNYISISPESRHLIFGGEHEVLPTAQDLVANLLHPVPELRWGYEEVRQNSFFIDGNGVSNFDNLLEEAAHHPYIPYKPRLDYNAAKAFSIALARCPEGDPEINSFDKNYTWINPAGRWGPVDP